MRGSPYFPPALETTSAVTSDSPTTTRHTLCGHWRPVAHAGSTSDAWSLFPQPTANARRLALTVPDIFSIWSGFGFDIAVIDAAAGARFLKGAPLYKVTALLQLFRFPGIDGTVASPAHGSRTGRHLIVTISNGRYFGGGFPIAPDAKVDDGLLHACLIRDAGPIRRAALFSRAERGHHVGAPEVEILSDRRFTVRFPEGGAVPRFEVDGDVFVSAGHVVDVDLLPKALEVVVA